MVAPSLAIFLVRSFGRRLPPAGPSRCRISRTGPALQPVQVNVDDRVVVVRSEETCDSRSPPYDWRSRAAGDSSEPDSLPLTPASSERRQAGAAIRGNPGSA